MMCPGKLVDAGVAYSGHGGFVRSISGQTFVGTITDDSVDMNRA